MNAKLFVKTTTHKSFRFMAYTMFFYFSGRSHRPEHDSPEDVTLMQSPSKYYLYHNFTNNKHNKHMSCGITSLYLINEVTKARFRE